MSRKTMLQAVAGLPWLTGQGNCTQRLPPGISGRVPGAAAGAPNNKTVG
jgi:hypothetical protein